MYMRLRTIDVQVWCGRGSTGSTMIMGMGLERGWLWHQHEQRPNSCAAVRVTRAVGEKAAATKRKLDALEIASALQQDIGSSNSQAYSDGHSWGHALVVVAVLGV